MTKNVGHLCPPGSDPDSQHCHEVVALLFQPNGEKRDLQTSEFKGYDDSRHESLLPQLEDPL
jgi:hypothetical protein